MKKLKTIKTATLLSAAMLPVLVVSCKVDEAYSLDNIKDLDTEVTLFSNTLEVPVGNVKMISLGSVIDLKGNEMIYTDAEGNYGIRVSGAAASSTGIDVPSITLSPFQVGKIELVSYDFPAASVGMSVPSFSQSLDVTNKTASIKIENDLPEGIVDIQSVTVNAPVTVKFSVSTGYITLKQGFTFAFPACLAVTCSSNDFEVVSGRTLRAKKDIQVSNGYTLNVTVTTITVPSGAVVASGSGKKIQINDNIVANGTVSLDGAAFATIPASISFDASVTTGTITVSSASAKINFSRTTDDMKVAVGELPDAIKDASLVLSDPVVRFTVNNGSPFEVVLNSSIVSKKNGAAVCTPISLNNVRIAANGTTDVYICKSAHAVPSGAVKVVAESIGELLKTIPDEVVISGISASVAPSGFVTVSSSSNYVVGTSYEVSTLLAFETGTTLGFSYSIDGLSLGDMDKVDIKDLDLAMNFVNSIPLDLAVNAKAFNSKGSEINGAQLTVNAIVKGGSLTAPATSPVTINIKADSLSDLDSIALDFSASVPAACSGIALNEKQGIAINDIVMKVNGGITVKMDDKK